jgi:hypothetical protein
MNLSPNPETICLHLAFPRKVALRIGGTESGSVKGRHRVEKKIQEWFYAGDKTCSYINEGHGTLDRANIFILTDQPAWALRALDFLLKDFPDYRDCDFDLREHCSIGWFDRADNLWRTYWPLTTRPFWTVLETPEAIEAILEKGRALRAVHA